MTMTFNIKMALQFTAVEPTLQIITVCGLPTHPAHSNMLTLQP